MWTRKPQGLPGQHAYSTNARFPLRPYEEYRLGAQATYSHFKPFDLVLGAGYDFERNFNYHRAGEEFKTEGAPFVRVAIEAKF